MDNIHNTSRFSSLHAWALSLGCAVGWGAFVMGATTLIPLAGPLGTLLGFALGTMLMLVIVGNFYILTKRMPHSDGLFSFTRQIFGYDHSFLCMWTVTLAFLSVLWANSTAIVLLMRFLFGSLLQKGFHYTLFGYDVWAGEICVSLIFIVLTGFIACKKRYFVRTLNTFMALVLFLGVVALFALVVVKGNVSASNFMPHFVHREGSEARSPFLQVISIAMLMPWAFVGFEAVSFAAKEYRFSARKTFWVMALSIIASALIYVLMVIISVAKLPSGCQNWQDYILHLGSFTGIEGLPTFFVVRSVLGKWGVVLLSVCIICALCTTMLGLYRSLGRILCAMAEYEILPKWFSKTNSQGIAHKAIYFVMAISLVIPFVGRTAIGWVVDITTISASIIYIYVSACSISLSCNEKGISRKVFLTCGIVGVLISLVFFFFPMLPNLLSTASIATESYLILAVWGIAGFVLFRALFIHDKQNRFGKSTVMWISMLFIILFSSVMWTRQTTHTQSEDLVKNISEFHVRVHEEQNEPMTQSQREAELAFMEGVMQVFRHTQFRNSIIQLLVILFALFIMFNIFSMQQKRERKFESEKIQAQESNKAKTVFLSNMSHDIRTPMNAIIGYVNLAQRNGVSLDEMKSLLSKIDSSSKHLLALINDVLEMSRIESGKMDLQEEPCDLRKIMEGMRDMFATQMSNKSIIYTVDTYNLKNPHVLCDKNRLNRVLLNLISNAFKFTPEGGAVSVSLLQKHETPSAENSFASEAEPIGYELRVSDTGIGMSEDFSRHVFEAFTREKTSTVSGIQGTGLGMAITKSIIDLMGGTISVNSKQGEGTEFVINIFLKAQPSSAGTSAEAPHKASLKGEEGSKDFSKMRLLLVDDVDINRELATMILEAEGFSIETAINGKEAVDKVSSADAGYYNAVLMDIQMPIMDGYEASRAIRAFSDVAKAQIPIVAMTANAFAEDVKKAHDAGMNAHVAKPIDVENLMSTLKALL